MDGNSGQPRARSAAIDESRTKVTATPKKRETQNEKAAGQWKAWRGDSAIANKWLL
jgi:hypothetical protein